MDRNTVTGLLLIVALTIAWGWFTMPSPEELEQQRIERAIQDSIAAAQAEQQDRLREDNRSDRQIDTEFRQQLPVDDEPEVTRRTALGVFDDASFSDTLLTTISTPLQEFEFTNVGAGPAAITLMNHETWENEPMQLIADNSRSAYSLGFLSRQNYNIETDQLVFEPLFSQRSFNLTEDETVDLAYRLQVDDYSSIVFTYTIYGNRYAYDLDVELIDMERHISGTNVEFGWKPRLNLSERDISQDRQAAAGYIYAGGTLEKYQLSDQGALEERINGTIGWVSTRNRFFGQFIKPVTTSNAATIVGEIDGPFGDIGTNHHYQAYVQSGIVGTPTLSYELYSGPLRYYDLRDFDKNAYDVIEIGYALIRWFADPLVRYAVIPFFVFGSTFISNFGILIILFGVAIKLILFPLTQKSFKSMAAMKELQPQMKEIQEKYKDDPQKQQKETIALYRKAKVNPLGGCLPMLLQFPILITMFFFFQNSMIIRQESFLWASDLSAPDYILNLPFSVPFLGDQLAGFVLLMSAAMLLQMKVSGGMSGGAAPSSGPNMKVFMYIMPVMLLFIFNNFASGLSLYYLVYNVLSIAQQVLINKQIAAKKPEEIEKAKESVNKKMKQGKKKKK